MTKALEAVLRKVARLPESAQDSLAAAIRAEIDAEGLWEEQLASSRETLAALADKALDEHRAGRTRPLDLRPR
jgi:hypothetical protein